MRIAFSHYYSWFYLKDYSLTCIRHCIYTVCVLCILWWTKNGHKFINIPPFERWVCDSLPWIWVSSETALSRKIWRKWCCDCFQAQVLRNCSFYSLPFGILIQGEATGHRRSPTTRRPPCCEEAQVRHHRVDRTVSAPTQLFWPARPRWQTHAWRTSSWSSLSHHQLIPTHREIIGGDTSLFMNKDEFSVGSRCVWGTVGHPDRDIQRI